jgi:hypothetical protein
MSSPVSIVAPVHTSPQITSVRRALHRPEIKPPTTWQHR